MIANRDLVATAELLMVMRLCGFVIDEHWEHLMTFNEAFPVPPELQTDKANREAMQLIEDATAETQLLGADDLIRHDVERVADSIRAQLGLAPIGALLELVRDAVPLSPAMASVVERTLDLFRYHRAGDSIRDPEAIATAKRTLAQLRAVGLFA